MAAPSMCLLCPEGLQIPLPWRQPKPVLGEAGALHRHLGQVPRLLKLWCRTVPAARAALHWDGGAVAGTEGEPRPRSSLQGKRFGRSF